MPHDRILRAETGTQLESVTRCIPVSTPGAQKKPLPCDAGLRVTGLGVRPSFKFNLKLGLTPQRVCSSLLAKRCSDTGIPPAKRCSDTGIPPLTPEFPPLSDTGIPPDTGIAPGIPPRWGLETMRRHGAKNTDYRGGVTCLYDTQLLGACLHASECGGRSRPGAVKGMPDVPIAPPATGPQY